MKPINILSRNFTYLLAPVSFLLLTSCGSYQYSGYGSDGIYGDADPGYDQQNQYATQEVQQETPGSYYKNLFAEEAALYGDVLAEGAIFTDVESYTSTGDYQPGQGQVVSYQGGRAPWGNDPDSYDINIYNNGFYGGMMNPFWGGMYGFDPFWGPGMYGGGMWGPGMYGGGMWGPGMWGPGLGWGGFYGPRFGGMWGNPWGYGYGFNFGFGVHPFIYGAGGWHNPYNFYGNRFGYDRDNVAYNRGRRNATSSYSTDRAANLRNATNLDSRRRSSSYSRSIRNLRNSNDEYGITRRSSARQYNSSRVDAESQYGTRRTRSFNSQTRRNDSYSRPTQSRSQGTFRSSSPMRSSGTIRSSGGGRSSGGAVRSSGGGSRGRGGN